MLIGLLIVYYTVILCRGIYNYKTKIVFQTLKIRIMGIIKNYQSKGSVKVTFSHPVSAANGAKTVQVLGDFNNWDGKTAPKMKKGKDEFSTVIELNAGQSYEFRYLIDNTQWDNDFSADGYVSSPYPGITNSVVVLDAIVATPAAKAKIATPKVKVEKSNPASDKAKPVVTKAKTVKVAEKKELKPVAAKANTAKKKETPTKATAPKIAKPIVKTVKDDPKK